MVNTDLEIIDQVYDLAYDWWKWQITNILKYLWQVYYKVTATIRIIKASLTVNSTEDSDFNWELTD